MLVEKTLFGIEDKTKTAIERLRYFEPPDDYYLAFSGGKDSIVIKHLARIAGVHFEAVHNLTTIDPPELIRYMREYHPDVIIDRPEKPFLRQLSERGFPMRQSRWCCEEYKERGGTGRLVVTGVRKAESVSRRRRQMVETCYKDKSKRYLNVIIDWDDQDVWEYIRGNNLPYCSLYDEGWKRIGCLFCPCAGKHRLVEVERYPKYVRAFIRAFEKLHATGRESMKRWENGEEMFWWWLKEDRRRKEPDQIMMFE